MLHVMFRLLCLFFFVVTATACGSTQTARIPDDAPGGTDTPGVLSQQQGLLNAHGQSEASGGPGSASSVGQANTVPTTDYILGAEDLIEITVFQVNELNRTVRISSSGYIKLPLLGKIKVSGLTVTELEAELSKQLDPYLQEPVVSVFVQEYRSQRITILGAVQRPQVHTVTRQNYLLDIVTLSGGFDRNAGELCYIRRGPETIIINTDDLLVDGNTSLNVPVYAGDVIHVPVGGTLFLDGGVRSPGPYSIKRKTTLTQAITMARGFHASAKKSGIKIYRENGNRDFDIISVNYKAILANEEPDIELQDKDIVIVPTSAVKYVLKTLGGAVRLGDSGSMRAGDF